MLKCAVHYTFICSKLPLLYINDVPVLGQSAVISRFLARRFGMMGDDDLEAAQNEMISEHIRDIKADCLKAKAAEDEAHSGEWTSTVLSKSCINLEKVVALTSKAHGNAVGASKHPHVQLARNPLLATFVATHLSNDREISKSGRFCTTASGRVPRARTRPLRVKLPKRARTSLPVRTCSLSVDHGSQLTKRSRLFDSRGQGGRKPRAEGVHCHAQGVFVLMSPGVTRFIIKMILTSHRALCAGNLWEDDQILFRDSRNKGSTQDIRRRRNGRGP